MGGRGVGGASAFHPSLKYSGNDVAATDQLIFLFLGFPRDHVFKCNILGATFAGACSSPFSCSSQTLRLIISWLNGGEKTHSCVHDKSLPVSLRSAAGKQSCIRLV